MNLNPQECSSIENGTYRNLCQTLSVPIVRDRDLVGPTTFSGNPNVDILILHRLSDQDLTNVCATNKYLNNLCNTPSFWLNKVISKYGEKLGHPTEIMNKYIPEGTSWKQYYIWLSNLLEGDKTTLIQTAIEYNRDDVTTLSGINVDEPVYITEGLRTFVNQLQSPINPLAASHGISTLRILSLLVDRYERKVNQVSPGVRDWVFNSVIPTEQIIPQRIIILQNQGIINKLNTERAMLESVRV